MKYRLSFIGIIYACCILAQDTVKITFLPMFKHNTLHLNQKNLTDKDSIIIQTLKFYITDIVFYKENKLVDKINKRYHLVDLENPASMTIQQNVSVHYDMIGFNIGIDSITNVSGVFGEDLDPTNGMYWTWQSGYINFKTEGKSALCTSRNKRFQLHIGGYQTPCNTLQSVKLKTNSKNIHIAVFTDEILNSANLSENCEIMSPNAKAVEISGIISKAFRIYEK